MAKTAGIPGLAVALATAGGFLLYAGIRDVDLLTGLREIVSGKVPTPRPRKQGQNILGDVYGMLGDKVTEALTAGAHPEIATQAKKYIGLPYVFGSSDPKRGLDCSGLVLRVFADLGYGKLPHSALAQTQMRIFKKVTREQVTAGDLVYWPGHIGIAADNVNGIFAPTFGQKVKITPIDVSGPFKGKPTLCVRYSPAGTPTGTGRTVNV